jgi:hypothetical protein
VIAAASLLAAPAEAALSPAQLLVRYQPVTVLHPAEVFRPVAVDGFLAGTALEQRQPDGTWAPSGSPTTSLPTAIPTECRLPCWRLNVPQCSATIGVASLACYAAAETVHPARNVVYGALHRRGPRIALQYWYWYSYNFWSGEYPPTDYVWQAHEGDWEMVTVVLDRAGKALFAGVSEHNCGKRRAWRRVRRWRRTQHPVVHVALGSHANSFSPRDLPLDLTPACFDPVGAGILRGYLRPPLDRYGEGARLGPRIPGVQATPIVRITDVSPPWAAYPGRWGEESLFHAPDPVGTNVYGPAPDGPRFHRIWREPIRTPLGWRSG